MSLPIIFRPEARAEFDEAYDWYEGQRVGLGEAFAMPGIHAAVFGDVRKAVVVRFAYCVFYRVEASCVRILSVFHTRRDPRIWQGRV